MATLALLPFRPLTSSLNSKTELVIIRKKNIRFTLRPSWSIRATNGQELISASVSTLNHDLKPHHDIKSVTIPCTTIISLSTWLSLAQAAQSSETIKLNPVYETSAFFELGIQLSYLLTLLGLLGAGTFFVIRQVLVRRELDLSAKELQEQVRSGDASATEYFELGAVMLRRKFYPAAIKYLREAINKWDPDDQDLAQVYNALGVSYVREGELEKGIIQFRNAVELQPGYVIAWNNLGDALERKKELKGALRAFEEALLFDPTNEVARPRAEGLRNKVRVYRGVETINKEKR